MNGSARLAKQPVIVCVGEELGVRASLQEQLTRSMAAQCQVATVKKGEDALAYIQDLILKGVDIPVVISDHHTTDLLGHDFLNKTHLLSPKTMKILLTGQSDMHTVGIPANHDNLYRCIAKPLDPVDLNMTVREAVRTYYQEKRLEEQNAILRDLNENLERKVVERTFELERRNAEKSRILGIAAHDLKNPLNGIIGLAKLLLAAAQDKKEKALSVRKKCQTYLPLIAGSAKKMFDIIDDLLSAEVIESGNLNLKEEHCDLCELAHTVVELNRAQANGKNICIHLTSSESCVIRTDVNRMREIMDNLISNAVKYSSHGTNVWVKIEREKKRVRFSVRDEGPGLTENDKRLVFGPFQKLSARPTGGESSTGLGLSIVKHLVEMQKGKVWVESVHGQGAIFIVEMPL